MTEISPINSFGTAILDSNVESGAISGAQANDLSAKLVEESSGVSEGFLPALESTIADNRKKASTYAAGFGGLVSMGQLGRLSPDMARTMIDGMAGFPDAVSAHFPDMVSESGSYSELRDKLYYLYDSAQIAVASDDSADTMNYLRDVSIRNHYSRLSKSTGLSAASLRAADCGGRDRSSVEARAQKYR